MITKSCLLRQLSTKKSFPNANLFLQIFELKVLPEENKQVGGNISNACVFLETNFYTNSRLNKKLLLDQLLFYCQKNWHNNNLYNEVQNGAKKFEN